MEASDAPDAGFDGTGGRAPLWLVFACDDNAYAVRLSAVREIVPPQPWTRLPGCGPEVCGLVGLRGQVITVFDLGAALGVRPAAGVTDHRLLLVERGDRVLGLVVDSITATHPLVVRMSDHGQDDAARADVVGVADLDGARILALDTDRILGRLLA